MRAHSLRELPYRLATDRRQFNEPAKGLNGTRGRRGIDWTFMAGACRSVQRGDAQFSLLKAMHLSHWQALLPVAHRTRL